MENETIDVYRVAVERYYDRAGKTWKVNRIRFETNKGVIIHKPVKERGVFREIGGKKVCFEHKEMISMAELSPVIVDVSHLAIEHGICKVKAEFQQLKRGGKTYLYFQREDIEQMEIMPLEEKVG